MSDDNKKNSRLQYVYLGTSLFSGVCFFYHFSIITCCNVVAFMCIVDLFYIKKKDMFLHHLFVLGMVHCIHNHKDFIENINEFILPVLSAEISTIFLSLNNLLEKSSATHLKKINKAAFLTTFFYFRIYNYFRHIVLNERLYTLFIVRARNQFEFYEICVSVYGMYLLNLYWSCLIVKRLFTSKLEQKSIQSSDKTK